MDVSDAWRQAHAMRRRLDRVNRTSSLVAYEERPNKAVPRAKAERVRRRMHYPMPLQCFQVLRSSEGEPEDPIDKITWTYARYTTRDGRKEDRKLCGGLARYLPFVPDVEF